MTTSDAVWDAVHKNTLPPQVVSLQIKSDFLLILIILLFGVFSGVFWFPACRAVGSVGVTLVPSISFRLAAGASLSSPVCSLKLIENWDVFKVAPQNLPFLCRHIAIHVTFCPFFNEIFMPSFSPPESTSLWFWAYMNAKLTQQIISTASWAWADNFHPREVVQKRIGGHTFGIL